MQSRARLTNGSQRLLIRDAPEHATGEAPDNERARAYVQMDSADVGSVATANPMDEEDHRIMKNEFLGCAITEVFSPARANQGMQAVLFDAGGII